MILGFIGFGEAAYSLAAGFSEAGISNILAYDVNAGDEQAGAIIRNRAQKTKVSLKSGIKEVVSSSDIIIAVIPPKYTVDVCDRVARYLKEGQMYVDVSASMPAAKARMADMVSSSKALFADVAMLGPLLSNQIHVPMAVSGSGADKWCEFMGQFEGCDVENVGKTAGSASAIKLVRSIYMKGTAALMVEMLQAADYYGVTDKVVTSISKSLDNKSFAENMTRLVTGTALHAERRAQELTGSQELLREAGLNVAMTDAAYNKHISIAKYNLDKKYAGIAPKAYQTVIDDMKDSLNVEG